MNFAYNIPQTGFADSKTVKNSMRVFLKTKICIFHMCIMILKNDTVGLCILYTLLFWVPCSILLMFPLIGYWNREFQRFLSLSITPHSLNDEGNIVSGHPVCALLAIEDTHEDC